MADFYEQVCNFLSSLCEDGFPIFPITQVFFLSIIYSISSVLDESGDPAEESNSQQVCFYIIITIFLAFDCFLFWLNPNEAREWSSAIGLPITTFIVAYFINKRQKDREIQEQQREKKREELEREREKAREDNKRKQEILNNYLSEMSGLLKDQDLDLIQPNSSVANLCKAFTISAISQLDSERNKLITVFLTEMGITIENKNKWGILKNAYLPESNLEGTNFERANLIEANFWRASLKRANFERANLEQAVFVEADLKEAIFSGANLKGASLVAANLEWSHLGANFEQASFVEANLVSADFRGANLSNASLIGANLNRAELKWTNLNSASLIGADLNEAKFRDAHLKGTDLSLTENLQQEQIKQAKGDEMTKLPAHLKMPEHWKNSADNQDNIESY